MAEHVFTTPPPQAGAVIYRLGRHPRHKARYAVLNLDGTPVSTLAAGLTRGQAAAELAEPLARAGLVLRDDGSIVRAGTPQPIPIAPLPRPPAPLPEPPDDERAPRGRPRKPRRATRMAAEQRQPSPPALPPVPPLTADQIAMDERIHARLIELNLWAEQQTLDRAVRLAQQAARRQGPLVAFFMELGRRYKDYKEEPQKPALRAIEGGQRA